MRCRALPVAHHSRVKEKVKKTKVRSLRVRQVLLQELHPQKARLRSRLKVRRIKVARFVDSRCRERPRESAKRVTNRWRASPVAGKASARAARSLRVRQVLLQELHPQKARLRSRLKVRRIKVASFVDRRRQGRVLQAQGSHVSNAER